MSNPPTGIKFSHPGRKYFRQKSCPRVAKVCQSPEGFPPSGPWWKQLIGALPTNILSMPASKTAFGEADVIAIMRQPFLYCGNFGTSFRH